MMKLVLVYLATCLLLAGQACADGKFFSAADIVREPDQKALLWHSGGRETLLIQVKYEGAAGDFGWVVPVPARPRLDTASPGIFYELAYITRPAYGHPWWSLGSRATAAGGVERGVTVVEQAQVGPYDATVLAATQARGLAAWLEEHGYAMPRGAARVLKSYVDRQWYYVAVRINARRVHDELLADLQQIAPEITSLEEAPDILAALVMRTADPRPKRGRELLARITTITDRALGLPQDLEALARLNLAPETEMAAGRPLLSGLDEYYAWRREFHSDLVTRDDAVAYFALLSKDAGAPSEDIVEAAKAMGEGQGAAAPDEQMGLAAAVQRDLMGGVAWRDSSLARLAARVSETASAPSASAVRQLRDDYETRRRILQEHSGVPPCEEARIEELENQASDPFIGDGRKWRYAAYQLDRRQSLYSGVHSAVALSAKAVETALSSGSIAPLRLDFDCAELIYPLYITSLNGAPVDLRLYILSDHRMAAKGFKTTFAGRLDEEALEHEPEMAKLVASGRDYLTELRAKLAPEEMTADLLFARARTDKPYREWTAQARLHPLVISGGVLLLLLALAGAANVYSRIRRIFARRGG